MYQRFYASRGKRHIQIQVCPRTRLFVVRGRLWTAEGLKALGIYESSTSQPLPPKTLGPFGDAEQFEGEFKGGKCTKKGGRPPMHYGLREE